MECLARGCAAAPLTRGGLPHAAIASTSGSETAWRILIEWGIIPNTPSTAVLLAFSKGFVRGAICTTFGVSYRFQEPMTKYKFAKVPPRGEGIGYKNGMLSVPDDPIIPFIEGDGTGPDIWRASVRVFDAAVEKAYGGERKIAWMEVFAGEKAFKQFNDWLPQETLDAMQEFRVSIKGPLTTPVGGGIRSLNVTLRQVLDLYACIRPVRYFEGVAAPVKEPEKVDIVIFRENTEDVYAGIEWKAGSPEADEARASSSRQNSEATSARTRRSASSRCPSSARSASWRWRSSTRSQRAASR